MSLLLLHSDARDIPLADKSVQCCVTSPPYWGFRLYEGVEPSVWGGDPACRHVFGDVTTASKRGHAGDKSTLVGTQTALLSKEATQQGAVCQKCGAWCGVLGGESLHDGLCWARSELCNQCYVCHIRMVAQEFWRVLRDDGTFWLNISDSYSSGGRASYGTWSAESIQASHTAIKDAIRPPQPVGLKSKNLIGIPWRVALALQSDGWILRSDIIWHKPSCMPESVRDRPTRAHEHVFLFSKQSNYFYDVEAISEPLSTTANAQRTTNYYDTSERGPRDGGNRGLDAFAAKMRAARKSDAAGINGRNVQAINAEAQRRDTVGTFNNNPRLRPNVTRNSRDVWSIPTHAFSGQHFACFPPALVERCLCAGTSEAGCCPQCRAPWVRQMERETAFMGGSAQAGRSQAEINSNGKWAGRQQGNVNIKSGPVVFSSTTGFAPSCRCDAGALVPCRVLDPFAGSGTTGLVARALRRDAILMDASFHYLHDIARERLSLTALDAWEHGGSVPDTSVEDLPLFARRNL